ncbi:Suppressor of SWI4 1 [Amphibalanus amphitrite]|uniref:Suppressor of SWI4 1 n=1 Tax=Amphibalanus amphitrite TaxID=1232801 RepID=A0A6A4WAK8_AMPAM|nr:Suppressor of SWI4 1 [Amphibalanus amphitrite]
MPGKTRRNNEASKTLEPEELKRAAHSFIVSRGRTGKYVSQLVMNFRKVMEPFTASQLKAKGTTVRDLASVAGPLGVTHLCLFTRSQIATYMKLAKFPRGPTITFRVLDYTLSRDVLHSLKRMVTYSKQFLNGPLLILNNFSGAEQHLQLTATMLQNMFPVLNVHKLKLNTLRRAVLFSYNASEGTIDFRHYTVKVVPVGISRGVKKLVTRPAVPNMGRLQDMADFVVKAGYMSESEGEDDPSSHVELAQPVRSRGNMVNARSAIRLIELGPRLTLQVIKAEAGLVGGEVLFHQLVTKTEEEIEATRLRREQREQLKARRRAEQQHNVERKQALKEELKQRAMDGMKRAMAAAAATNSGSSDSEGEPEEDAAASDAEGGQGDDPAAGPAAETSKPSTGGGSEGSGTEEGDDEGEEDDDDDAEWYRKEVGQEPDEEFRSLASGSGSGGASRSVTKRYTKKRPGPGETPRGAKRGRREEDKTSAAERWKPRNKRGRPISGTKVRRKQTAAAGRR